MLGRGLPGQRLIEKPARAARAAKSASETRVDDVAVDGPEAVIEPDGQGVVVVRGELLAPQEEIIEADLALAQGDLVLDGGVAAVQGQGQSLEDPERQAGRESKPLISKIMEVVGSLGRDLGVPPGLGERQGRGQDFAEHRLGCLIIDGLFEILIGIEGHAVKDTELTPGRLGVGEDIEFQGRGDAEPGRDIAVGRIAQVDGASDGPMIAQASDVESVQRPGLRGALLQVVFVVELAFVIAPRKTQAELRGGRHAADRDVAVEGVVLAGLLAVEPAAGAETEYPEVPLIDDGRRLKRPLRVEGQDLGDRRPGRVGGQPELQDLDHALPDFVLGFGPVRVELELVVQASAGSLADEGDCVFPAAAAGSLLGDQDVDVGLPAVPDIVDEGDLGPDIVDIDAVPVDEDLGRGLLKGVHFLGRYFLSGIFRGKRGRNRVRRRCGAGKDWY